jgi:hypothetical protein
MVIFFQGLISILASILPNKLSVTLNFIENLTHMHPYAGAELAIWQGLPAAIPKIWR